LGILFKDREEVEECLHGCGATIRMRVKRQSG